jgi:DNA-binding response OmpR family regulator
MSGGSGQKRQLGKILLKQKLVTPDELQELLDRQRAEPGKRLASAALDSGRLREVDLLKALSEQHGLPGIDLAQVVVPLANLKLIPEEIARQHLILPILVKDDRIYLAMADPQDRRVIDEIEFVTGRRVFSYVAIHDSLVRVIKLAYDQAERGEAYYVGPDVPADYLRSLGLEAGILEPTPGQRQVVVDEAIDELGIEELGGDIGAMADSQVSRVRDGAPRTQRVVLVVDDEDDIRRLLKRALTDAGYAVVEAARGIEALERVRAEVPDVILLDAMLPEVHGFDICRRIKGSKRYGHIPVIMVSAVYRGWRFAEDLKESYGVDAFLEKPFKIADVLAAVERALQGTRDESVSDGDLSREASEALERGIEAYQAGDLEKAIGELQRGVGIDPLSFKLHYHLGLLYGRRDDLFEGIHELETAVDLQPRNFSALKNLAVLYQRAGFKHKAIEMWERALASAPDDDTRKGIKEHLMTLL